MLYMQVNPSLSALHTSDLLSGSHLKLNTLLSKSSLIFICFPVSLSYNVKTLLSASNPGLSIAVYAMYLPSGEYMQPESFALLSVILFLFPVSKLYMKRSLFVEQARFSSVFVT